jgi:hypothetical protein
MPGFFLSGVFLSKVFLSMAFKARAISTGALDAPACTGADIFKMPVSARDVRFVKSGGID